MTYRYVMIFAPREVDREVLRRACRSLNWGISNEPSGLVNARGETSKVRAIARLLAAIDDVQGRERETKR